MGIFETFSKRNTKVAKSGVPDVYIYDDLPPPLRNQIVFILRDAIGPYQEQSDFDFNQPVENNDAWIAIHDTMCRELGLLRLAGDEYDAPDAICFKFLQKASVDQALDLIEVSFSVIERLRSLSERDRYRHGIKNDADSAIKELNYRFQEHGIGYQFVNGAIIKIDSQFVHAEVTKNALILIHQGGFRGAEDEFRKAHEHYRYGRTKEALNEGLKAFESAAKVICDTKKWDYPPNANAKVLIEVLFSKELVPKELQSNFSALRSTLEAGLPTIRNRKGGHGQGKDVIEVPGYLAAYALHLTASAIVFMVEAAEAN
ncbi:MAG: STM4504/CBY_0614 family protein [Oligoflexales bacterium]